MKHERIAAGLVLAAALAAAPASAEEPYVLATSKAHKLQVLADGGANWCRPALRLRIVLEEGSQDAGNTDAQLAMMNRLKTPLQADCKTASSAELTVSGPGAAAGKFTATASGGWVFAVPSAVASAPPTPAAEPAWPEPESNRHEAPPRVAAAASPVQPPAALAAPDAHAPGASTSASSAALIPAVPAPAPAAVAPAAPTTPAPTPEQPSRTVETALPKERGYASALLAFVRQDPSRAESEDIQKAWAGYRFQRQLQSAWRDEFKLHELLQNAQADLAQAAAATDGKTVALTAIVEYGRYDFKAHRFPIRLGGDTVNMRCCEWQSVPSNPPPFRIKVRDLDLFEGIALDQSAAQAFEERRSHAGFGRQVVLVISVRLGDPGFGKGNLGEWGAEGDLESITVLGDDNNTKPVYQFAAAEVEAARAERRAAQEAAARAEQERREAAEKARAEAAAAEQMRLAAEAAKREAAEKQRQHEQALARRQQNIQDLDQAGTSAKLANWISSGPLSPGRRLMGLRDVRGVALLNSRLDSAVMLVRMASSGRDKVDTSWPGHLQVSVPRDQPELSSSSWYLVEGTVTVPEGDGLPPALLAARSVYACTQPQCAEAADASAVVDRKIAATEQRK
jgi:hypothetical protein